MYSLKNEPETHFPSNNVTFRGTGMCLVRCVTCAKFWAGLTHRQTIFLFCQEYTSRLTVVLIYRKWKGYCFITLGADDNLFRFSSLLLSHCAIFLWTLIIQHVFFFFFLLDGFPFFLTGAVHFSILTFILITWVYFSHSEAVLGHE